MQPKKLYLKRVSRLATILFPLTIFFILSGCATMGKNECLNADWKSVGYEDGARGYQGARIGEHRKACADYNVTPDLQAYSWGRLQGLAEWCKPANGYRQGARGTRYNGVCPPQYEAAFLQAMDRGRVVYEYKQKIRTRKNELNRWYKEREQREEDIGLMEEELIRAKVGPKRRWVLLNDIRAAERELGQLDDDISEAEFNLEELQRTLNRLEADSRY